MYAISNADFRVISTLLGELQRLEGDDIHTKEAKRKAKRLRNKLSKKKPNK